LGEWFSIYGYAERVPPRVSFTITFGDLPEGWTKSQKPRVARTWIGVLGLVLIAPFILLIAAYLLRALGMHTPYDLIAASPPAILAATMSFFIGFPIAFVLNVVPISPSSPCAATPVCWRACWPLNSPRSTSWWW